MIQRYGQRFIEAGQFVRFCRDLKVDITLNALMRYEQAGRMLPIAIVSRPAFPDQRQQDELMLLGEPERSMLEHFRGLPDTELIHCFDRQMGLNSLIESPLLNKGKALGGGILTSAITRYYSYWQVHQAYAMKHGYTRIWPISRFYNWLSYWLTMDDLEHKRTFAEVHPKDDETRILEGHQRSRYHDKRRKHSRKVQRMFNITKKDHYTFLHDLIDMYQDYLDAERHKLAGEIQKDALRLATMMHLSSGVNFNGISDRLRVFSNSVNADWYRQTFRNFDIPTKERDDARLIIKAELPSCIKKGVNERSIDAFVDSFLDYCEQHLPIVISAMSRMIASEEERLEKFRHVNVYANMQSLLTSFEYLLRHMASARGIEDKGYTMFPLLKVIMKRETWWSEFEPKTRNGTLPNLVNSFSDQSLSYWPRTFLTVCIARNLLVHKFFDENPYDGDIFSPVLRAVVAVFAYTWRIARAMKLGHMQAESC